MNTEFVKLQLEIATELGMPINDLVDNLLSIGPALDAIFDLATPNPRAQMVMLSMYCCVQAKAFSAEEHKEAAVERFAEMLPRMDRLLRMILEEKRDEEDAFKK